MDESEILQNVREYLEERQVPEALVEDLIVRLSYDTGGGTTTPRTVVEPLTAIDYEDMKICLEQQGVCDKDEMGFLPVGGTPRRSAGGEGGRGS